MAQGGHNLGKSEGSSCQAERRGCCAVQLLRAPWYSKSWQTLSPGPFSASLPWPRSSAWQRGCMYVCVWGGAGVREAHPGFYPAVQPDDASLSSRECPQSSGQLAPGPRVKVQRLPWRANSCISQDMQGRLPTPKTWQGRWQRYC